MRLIDADALLKEANADGAYGYVDAEQIANVPTIEAEPIKHGRWIAKQTALGTKYTVCSNCVYGISIPLDGHLSKLDLSDVPRCPNCGAKMDGDAE